MALAQPWALFALLPLRRPGQRAMAYSWLALLPRDGWSTAWDWGLRILGALAIAALALGLAGPYRQEQWRERTGTGAHIVLLLDRSSSMNDNFSGRYLGGGAQESKSAVARRLLAEFIQRRQHDLFAMVAFSAAPVYVLPLTQDREAILAAVRGNDRRGHGNTNVASGLAMALSHFDGQPKTGSRVVLLVSDGAAHMDEAVGQALRQRFQDSGTMLYWIYLRGRNAASLYKPPAVASETTSPEFFLHRYFRSLDVPYQAYEADNPDALRQAIADIKRRENQPLHYYEKQPRQDVSGWCYGAALAAVLLLLAAKRWEIEPWRT